MKRANEGHDLEQKEEEAPFPVLLACCSLHFDLKSSGMDFVPFHQIWSAERTRVWLCQWTGNDKIGTLEDFRIFGHDRSGGCAALWIRHPSCGLDEQPIVCFESEGKSHPVARNAKDFLWLLAAGVGPLEAERSLSPDYKAKPQRRARKLGLKFAADAERSAKDIVISARQEFQDFSGLVEQMSKKAKN